MLQIFCKEDFERLCKRPDFVPIQHPINSQEPISPEIGRVESQILDPLDLLFTKREYY